MSWLPTAKKPLQLLGPRKPNYSDYHGPADGDYVRYVQELMDWAEQEQTRQRLQAARQASRAPATEWGRSSAQPSAAPTAANPLAQLRNWARSTAAQLPQSLTPSPEPAPATAAQRRKAARGAQAAQPKGPAPAANDKRKAAPIGPVVLMVVVALLLILGAAELIPIAMLGFVGYHLTRSIRGAKADQSKS